MFKRCKVIMLPTNNKESAKIQLVHGTSTLHKYSNNSEVGIPLHLYILSDDEIPRSLDEDCCIFNLSSRKVVMNPSYLMGTDKLVIGSTNQNLNLPKISQDFIEKYIKKHNEGNNITDVLVEYEIDGTKSNSRDNTITIHEIKDSYTRDEVINLLIEFVNKKSTPSTESNMSNQSLKDWFRRNL